MYTTFFGFNENPFKLTPDPQYLYLSPRHREAMNHLIYGITERKGFIVITGGIGTGKTTLSRSLMASLDESVDTALIFNSAVSDMELLSMITREFNLTIRRGRPTRKTHIDALNEFLLKNFASGRNAVLLIDEAQNLSPSVLEQIRMLSNLETEREKLLQIILLGQPELKHILGSPALRQLNERISVRYDLQPLDREQVSRYISHRMAVADGQGTAAHFTEAGNRLIFRVSRGNPRKINVICDRALVVAYALNTSLVDRRIIRKALRDIGSSYLGNGRPMDAFSRPGFSAALLVVLLLALGAVFYSSWWDRVLSFVKGTVIP